MVKMDHTVRGPPQLQTHQLSSYVRQLNELAIVNGGALLVTTPMAS